MAVTTANMVRNPTLSSVALGEVGAVSAPAQPLAINDGNGAPPVGHPSPAFKLLQRNSDPGVAAPSMTPRNT